MTGWLAKLISIAVILALLAPGMAAAARIKDIAQLDGVRDNQLMGYGLVGGLAGTGDDPKSSPYTAEAIANMLGAWGFQVDPVQLKVKNFAAVMVTANLPAYLSGGDRLDVTLSSIGTAKSLEGGVLYQTMLKGADGKIYAVAQGQLSLGSTVGGGTGGGGGGGRSQIKTVGRIPGGALIEASVPSTLLKSDGTLCYNLKTPDFTTAAEMVAALNAALGGPQAHALNAGTIAITVPAASQTDLVPFVAAIENLNVEPGALAKVVINQRTGTVVIGQTVEIRPVAVTHGSMTLTFGEGLAAQGVPALDGETAPSPEPATGTELPALLSPEDGLVQPPAGMEPGPEPPAEEALPVVVTTPAATDGMQGNTSAAQVAEGLNKMHLAPADIVAIFEAIAASGALMGELEII